MRATPVGISGLTLQRKVTNDAVASIRSMAETYGRNAEVAESFVREADEHHRADRRWMRA